MVGLLLAEHGEYQTWIILSTICLDAIEMDETLTFKQETLSRSMLEPRTNCHDPC